MRLTSPERQPSAQVSAQDLLPVRFNQRRKQLLRQIPKHASCCGILAQGGVGVDSKDSLRGFLEYYFLEYYFLEYYCLHLADTCVADMLRCCLRFLHTEPPQQVRNAGRKPLRHGAGQDDQRVGRRGGEACRQDLL